MTEQQRIVASETNFDKIFSHWEKFHRALRKKDRNPFDSMMEKVKPYLTEATPGTNPTENLFLAILIEQELELEELKKIRERQAPIRSQFFAGTNIP